MFCGSVMTSAQEKVTYSIDKPGSLTSLLTEEAANNIVDLKLTGKINAIDFRHLRDEFKHLKVLDLSGADIAMYFGKEGTDKNILTLYRPNYIPKYAFSYVENGIIKGKTSLQKIILPASIKGIDMCAFKGCDNLTIVELSSNYAPRMNDEALSDTISTVFVPLSGSDNFRRSEQWSRFSVIEGEPVSVKLEIGKLSSLENEILKANVQPAHINYLTIAGKLDENDFMLIRNYMSNLTYIDMSQVTTESIPDFTFSQKKYLLKVILPEGLKKIGQRAFSGCSKLGATLILPPKMVAIESGAFIDCDHLRYVIVTGNKIAAIGDNLFGSNSKGLLVYKK